MRKQRLKMLIVLMVLSKLTVGHLHADTATVQADGAYLFEVLENPVYLQTWDTLISTHENVDEWLVEYAKTRNGPATPASIVHLGGKRYQLNFVCKAHDCGDNHFVVMFNHDGTEAWGVLRKAGQEDLYFGSPNREQINALLEEAAK